MLIYCVEDDENIKELVLYTLKATGYEAEGFSTGRSFFLRLEEQQPDLLLLDIMLPEEDGLSILKQIRRGKKNIPVILLTAKSTELDKVVGLDTGADDYITKPFGMMELISRIKAVLRRSSPQKQGMLLEQSGVQVDKEKHLVRVDNSALELTRKEFDLLVYLMEHSGIVLTRDQILEQVWGYDYGGETRTVDVHIRCLRQKLGEKVGLIGTVRGVGYRWEEDRA